MIEVWKYTAKGLGFLKWSKKYYTAADIHAIYTASAEFAYSERLGCSWAIKVRPELPISRNAGCFVLTHGYSQDKPSTEIKEICSAIKSFNLAARL